MVGNAQRQVLVTAERIVTAADGRASPYASGPRPALLLLGERVVATGDLDALRKRAPEAELVDLGAATVVPGFKRRPPAPDDDGGQPARRGPVHCGLRR